MILVVRSRAAVQMRLSHNPNKQMKLNQINSLALSEMATKIRCKCEHLIFREAWFEIFV